MSSFIFVIYSLMKYWNNLATYSIFLKLIEGIIFFDTGKIFEAIPSFFVVKRHQKHITNFCCLRDVFHGLERIKYSLSTPFQ